MLEKEISRLEGFVFQCGDFSDIQAWQTLKAAVSANTSTNPQSTPCKHCSGAHSMFGIGCYCPWCGRKIE